MANFGFDDLAAVEPFEERWRLAQSAIYGSEVLSRARLCTLKEAVADCHLVLGTASAHNRVPRRTTITLPALRSWLKRRLPKGGRLAVVFGSERNGLENEELAFCHALLRIPTVPEAPSMNLGQAVALTAFELAREGLERSVAEPDVNSLDGAQLDRLVETVMTAMDQASMHRHMGEATRRRKIRESLTRWKMTRGDGSWLQQLLSSAESFRQ